MLYDEPGAADVWYYWGFTLLSIALFGVAMYVAVRKGMDHALRRERERSDASAAPLSID